MFRTLISKRRQNLVIMSTRRVLLVADRPNWAYDTIARALVKFNDDPDLILDIEYVKNGKRLLENIHRDYDLIFFLGWQTLLRNESYKLRYKFIDKKKILTGIHSHHAWDGRASSPDKSIPPPIELIMFLKQFAGVNAVSRRLYELFLGSGLDTVTYTPNGVDTSIFTATNEERVNNELRVGFSGNDQHDWRKGIREFIEPATRMDGISLKLAMPNDGHHVAPDQMPSFYENIDVYLCASLSEGFSLSVLEAAASGCPIISTRIGGCEDLIIDGVNGFFVDRDVQQFREKLMSFRDDHETLRKMGRQSRQITNQLWSWKIRAPAWLAFINSRLRALD